MAIVANTAITYTQGGTNGIGRSNREHLVDMITNISPVDCPVTNAMQSTTATAVQHEWVAEELAAAANNAHIEGDETSFGAVTTGTRLTNMCQISKKAVIVSRTQDKVRKAGKAAELAHQIRLRVQELKRDREFAIMQNTTSVTGNATTARQLKGIAGFITTNTSDASAADLTMDMINARMSDAWTEGGRPSLVSCGAHNKTVISGLTAGVTKNVDADKKEVVTAVEIIETDFGRLQIVPNRFQAADDVYFLDMERWKLAELDPIQIEALGKSGDASKTQITNEYTLESCQEKASASITNTSTS